MNNETIQAIASILELGVHCVFDKQKQTVTELLGEENWDYLEEEDKIKEQQMLADIEANPDNFILFEPMSSHEKFIIMQNFAEQISEQGLQTKLLQALDNRKPFRNFQNLIDDSAYRQDWFDFKAQSYVDYVQDCILDG